jgi:hypothetical protein
MLQNFSHLFSSFSSESRVWVYTSNRELTIEEVEFASTELSNFVATWNAHGKVLNADSMVLFNRFLILTVDERFAAASGCSIDSSVKVVKFLGQKLKIDFFDRLKIYIEKESEFKRIPFSDLKSFSDWNYFNPMIISLGELRTDWYSSVKESVFS